YLEAGGRAVVAEDGAFLLKQGDVGQVRSGHGIVTDLDRRVRILTRLDAFEEILNVRLGRGGPLILAGHRRRDLRPLPDLGEDAIAVVVEHHGRLLTLNKNLPAVLV